MGESQIAVPVWLMIVLMTVLAGVLGWILRNIFETMRKHEERIGRIETWRDVQVESWNLQMKEIREMIRDIWSAINELRNK